MSQCLPKTSLLERVTPLARQINSLDIDRIADVCVTKIPMIVGSAFASLYSLDEANRILHLVRHNHPFPINKIVSLNQTPPSPMVLAVKSRELILTGDIDTHRKPVIKRSQRAFAENYRTSNCAIVPLICHNGVVGVLNLADKVGSSRFGREDIALIETVRAADRGLNRQYQAVRADATSGHERRPDRPDESSGVL